MEEFLEKNRVLGSNSIHTHAKGQVKQLKESVKGFEANFKEFKLFNQWKCFLLYFYHLINMI